MSLYFTRDHEWIRVDGDIATVGISDHAQHALGDIVFAEVPEAGKSLAKGDDAVWSNRSRRQAMSTPRSGAR